MVVARSNRSRIVVVINRLTTLTFARTVSFFTMCSVFKALYGCTVTVLYEVLLTLSNNCKLFLDVQKRTSRWSDKDIAVLSESGTYEINSV